VLPSLAEYQQFIYGLPGAYPVIRHATLVVVQHGPAFAEVTGNIEFDQGIILSVWEDLNFARSVIQGYSYLVTQGEEQLYWYDPQPHPNDTSLASTHPHHKHIQPDIKHHRIPASGISFDQPNLPYLIEEIGQWINQK
jgi:hypothetical protein